MTRVITSKQITLPIPPGPYLKVWVSARYRIADEVIGSVSWTKLKGAIGLLSVWQGPVWQAVSESAKRAYRASGLRVISGELIANATEQFDVNVSLQRPNLVVVIAQWRSPTIPYFFFQLFGNLPLGGQYAGRNFIRLDGKANTTIAQHISRSAAIALREAEGERRVSELSPRRQEIARASRKERGRRKARDVLAPTRISRTGRRISPRRVRRELRRGGLGEEAARQLEAESRGLQQQVGQLQALIQMLLVGRGVTTAQPFRFQVVGGATPPPVGGRSLPSRFFTVNA